MVRGLIATLISIAFAGCADTHSPEMAMVRTDGEPIRGNPKLEQALQVDQAVCLGERQKASLSGVTFSSGAIGAIISAQERSNAADTVMYGCLAQRGYVIVRTEDAAAKAASFREMSASPSATQTGSVNPSQAASPSQR